MAKRIESVDIIGDDEVAREEEIRDETRYFLNQLIDREGEMLLGKSLLIVEDEVAQFRKDEGITT
jgi:hypothetical protein